LELSLVASDCDYSGVVCGVEKFVLSLTVQMILMLGVFIGEVKLISKAVFVQAWAGLECCRRLRLPDLQTISW
jgi:hypothetical protein